MIADAWSPNTTTMLRRTEHIPGNLSGKSMINQSPVYKITRMQNGQSRTDIEARSCHPEIIANATNIRVGIISMDDGIAIHAIAKIGNPNLRLAIGEKKRT